MKTYDHILIGTGQATGTLLGRLIPTGDSIAVIEGARVGGSCVNYGCTPTKTLVASARAAQFARRGAEYGFETGPVRIDFARVRERMNRIRRGSSDGLAGWMNSTPNVDLIHGWAKFDGTPEDPKVVRVGDEVIRGQKIYINVGTRPTAPPIEGLDSLPWLDSERLLDLEDLPERLLVIGGGYIGLELAQVCRRLGSEVTVIQYSPRLMPREDPDVAAEIRAMLEGEGIRILCNASTEKAGTDEDGQGVRLEVRAGDATEILRGSHVLVATGRRPNSDTLNLEAAGIGIDERGFIEVDTLCRTHAEGIFAVGDVNGHGAFTHTAVNDAEIVLDHLFDGDRRLSDRIPIYALYTDPPLGRVGLTETQAVATGRKILKAGRPMQKISRAKEMGETVGFVKILVDGETDRILGASILGVTGDEVINMLATVMHADLPWQQYRKIVLAHPTVSELIPWTLDALEPVVANTASI